MAVRSCDFPGKTGNLVLVSFVTLQQHQECE